MEPNRLTEEEISLYIKGELDQERALVVEEILKNSKKDFYTYVSLKEALFLMKEGKPASVKETEQILHKVKQSQLPHVQIIVRYLKEKILISSSDQEELEYQGIMANFALRGSEPGPVSITRILDGREITLTLTPGKEQKEFFLQVVLKKPEKLSVTLKVNGEETEMIPDISRKKMFDTPLPKSGDIDLLFYKKGKDIFSIGISLAS